MKFIWLKIRLIACLCLAYVGLNAQANPDKMDIIRTPGQLLSADASWTDPEGWTHFYNTAARKLLISIHTKGVEIGQFDEGLDISVGLLNGYGKQANDLSDADYLKNNIWLTMNRYWRIRNAVSVESKMKVRFYFTQQDFYDVKNGMASFEGKIQEFEDLIFYTLSKASLHPFAIVTQPAKGAFTMYNTKRDGQAQWYRGTQNNVSYAEFEIDDLNVSGGAGYKIALEDKLLAVSGQILDKHNQPLSSITVFANGEPKEQSNVDGYYAFSGLFPGKDYDIQPIKDELNGNITVLDLIAVSRHAFVGEPIENYYSMIAGDINGSNAIKK